MLRREVVEREQFFAVLRELLDGLRVLGSIRRIESVEGNECLGASGCNPGLRCRARHEFWTRCRLSVESSPREKIPVQKSDYS